MEGLLPMVYRAVKKTRTRQKYERLPSAAALSYSNIGMAEFYPQSELRHVYQTASTQKVPDFYAEKMSHRRHKSVGDFAFGFSASSSSSSPRRRTRAAGSPTPRQLVRFRSHRMFTCITGV